jgi:hypothetical protein
MSIHITSSNESGLSDIAYEAHISSDLCLAIAGDQAPKSIRNSIAATCLGGTIRLLELGTGELLMEYIGYDVGS